MGPHLLSVALGPALCLGLLVACAGERAADAVATGSPSADVLPTAVVPTPSPLPPSVSVPPAVNERPASATPPPDPETEAAFRRIMAHARAARLHTRPMGEIVQAVGLELLGQPYRAGLLDMSAEETLVVNLTAFDCVLYVESVLALARGIALEDYTYEAFARNVEALRYRGGRMDGYCSRLHYFSDWIGDNDGRRLVRDVTREIGGEPFEKRVDFMSTHRRSYARLADDETYACIQGVEAALARRPLFYVPEARVRAVYGALRPGDVIATATDIGGLDVTHTGFVLRTESGGTAFLNASVQGEVRISNDLVRYLEYNRPHTGIIVARPVDPRDAGGSKQ